MRIIGGHDYYDSAMSLGHDSTTVLVRQKAGILTIAEAAALGLGMPTHPFRVDLIGHRPIRGTAAWSRRIVGDETFVSGADQHTVLGVAALFCGRLYSGAVVVTVRSSTGHRPEHTFFWDWASLAVWADSSGISVNPSGRIRPKGPKARDHFVRRDLPTDAMARVVAKRISIATRLPEVLTRDRRDVWMVDGDGLGAMQFWKVLDAYSAFQELDMWLGGVLPRSASPAIEIADDRIRIHKAGFDARTSFRHRMTS